jgi:fructokinase
MRIGVDVGGTKTEAAVLNESGELLLRRRVATPIDDYPAAIEAIAGLIASIETEIGRHCSIGFGIPGTISLATHKVKNAYNSPFNGHPLDRDLESRLDRPIRMTNDANCFALSEATGGAAAGASIVFGVILGTGCGGGIVIDGKVLAGANAIGGEWGHNPLPWMTTIEQPGFSCACGLTGCVETFLSGTGFAAHHNKATGQSLKAHEIATREANGDRECTNSLEKYETQLARALASVINVIDPEIIVLGGGMSNIDRLYANVPALWSNWVFSDHVDTKLVPPAFGDSSGVRGAAWLWPEDGPA